MQPEIARVFGANFEVYGASKVWLQLNWEGLSVARCAVARLEWVDWFNNRRLLEPIGNIPPAEAEERYYAMLDEPAMAA